MDAPSSVTSAATDYLAGILTRSFSSSFTAPPASALPPPLSLLRQWGTASPSITSAGNLLALAQQSDLAESGPPELVSGGGAAGNSCLKGIPALVGGHDGFLDPSKSGISEETALKIINQVEFYLSDINLATTDFLFKIMIKDPKGFVPISFIASMKKIKTLTKSPSQLAAVLRNSSKLVVREDGKKVRRVSELDIEEVQGRIIIAENLPDDRSHRKLLKIFSAVGSVKAIRTCQPNAASKTDDKVHAFVEYDSVELAEKAVMEGNWSNGLKIRLLLKRSPKSGQESENSFREEEEQIVYQGRKYLEDFIQQPVKPVVEEHANSKDDGLKKRRSSWGKGRGNHMVPRMPDGTRGFSMGRGKPVAVTSG